jgi:tetratricopeptide (TPR) repeat protein
MTETSASDSATAVLFHEVFKLMEQNDFAKAESVLEQILADDPREADALQLMGVVCRSQQRDADAEIFYRRSLDANPQQPHVRHNLGNLLRRLGRLDESIAEQRAAIALKPNYAEAYLGLGLALLDKGDRENPDVTVDRAEAEKVLRKALHIRPGYLEAQRALAVALNELNRPKESQAILRQILASGRLLAHQAAEVEFNLGVSAGLENRYEDALKLYELAEMKGVDTTAINYNRGNAFQGLGMADMAVRSYRAALAGNPLSLETHRNLNHLLYRLGDDENFLRSYDEAIQLYPEKGELHLAKANFLFLKSDIASSLDSFEEAIRLMPEEFVAHDGFAQALARKGDFARAIHHHEAAARLRPLLPQVWVSFAETLLRAGDARGALAKAQNAVERNPFQQGAYSIMGIAYDLLGDARAEILNDYEDLVRVFEIMPPDGYGDIASFNADLTAYLNGLHHDRREVVDQTLRGGTQTMGHLFNRNHRLIKLLRASIERSITDYIGTMKEDERHPLLSRKSRKFGYAGSWSSRLRDCGFHENHYHGKGWISSAYYVSLPDAVTDAEGKEGWIKFGEPSFDAGLARPVRRVVQPRPGSLVLFPSYMWHGTIPFHSQTDRLTVAFDVVPKAG